MIYNGDRPVQHRVRPGETLSGIAKHYRFPDWKPVYIFNTKIHPVLSGNPDAVAAGTEILIPRSKTGYDKLCKKLRLLKQEAQLDADKIKYSLESEWNKHQGTRVMFDFAGDVLTLVGTIGAKAAQAARARKAAATATGRGRAAAQYLADQATDKLKNDLKGNLKDKVVGEALGLVDKDLKQAHKDLYLSQKKGLTAIQNVSLQNGRSLLDIADLLLDYVSVSSVADGVLALMVGEMPGQTHQVAQASTRKSPAATTLRLDERIRFYEVEKASVYQA